MLLVLALLASLSLTGQHGRTIPLSDVADTEQSHVLGVGLLGQSWGRAEV
jgi:hypothetical protein